ncbi:MAG TPA: S9 family peptidase [Pyrinomonadaceae bacterium]|nr:S9 family peptidase [Pyrinomonadaceae bacterium]
MDRKLVRFALVLLLFSLSVSAQKRAITETDLFDFAWVGDPQVSPDGSKVAYVKVTVNTSRTNYDTSIWTISTSGNEQPIRLTGGSRDTSPRWSPDGRFLAFVRSGETPAPASAPQIYLLPMAGGEAFQLTNVPRGAGGPVWSPDGNWIAFGSSANAEDIARQGRQPVPGQRDSDVRVITRAVYRSDGGGYLDPTRPNHLWAIAAPGANGVRPSPKQLTSGPFSEGNFVWAADGSRIYFTTNRDPEPYYSTPKTEIFSISPNGGSPELLTRIDMGVGALSLSPDGKRFAFVASVVHRPVKSYSQPDLWVLDITPNASPRNLTANFDFDIAAGLTGDQASPRAGGGNAPIWSADGRQIIERFAREGRSNLASFDAATGRVTEITKGDHAVMNYRATRDGARLIYTLSTPTRIGDLFISERQGTNARQLTRVNDDLFAKLNLTEPDDVWYTTFDGKRVQTWVQKPPDFDPNKKYPLILNIHGGPHAAYGYIFSHEFQWMAAKGYVVVYPNPRGSTSYGQDFGNIIQHAYPGDDHKDLMIAVDEVIKRGYIDTAKLAITGGSGGGVLTNYAVTQTDRFAAAVSQRDISDWANWWYTADFAQFQPSWFKGAPFEDVEGFRERSAITHVAKIKTPMMFILGEADWRTPPAAGGEELFRALKYRRVPTVMVRFPNANHDLSRTGNPWHRIERLQHIVGWFDKWLLGVSKPEYEIGLAP